MSDDDALPIELLVFDAKYNGKTVDLIWKTATEINNDYFTVEKSIEGGNFEQIGTLRGAGNSSVILNYSLEDKYPHIGTAYYRLKQTDFDGSYSYSDIVSVVIGQVADQLRLFAFRSNKYEGFVRFELNSPQADNFNLRILDMSGRVYHTQKLDASKGTQTIEISNLNLARGIYLLELTNKTTKEVVKFMFK